MAVFQLGWEKGRGGGKINWAHSSALTTKIWAQFSVQTTHNRAQFRARMTKFTFTHERPKFSQNPACKRNDVGRALYNRAGRKTVRAWQSALGNMPSWNTEWGCVFLLCCSVVAEIECCWLFLFLGSHLRGGQQ